MNHNSSLPSPDNYQVQQKDEMQMKGQLSEIWSGRKSQSSFDDSTGNLLESGLVPTCTQLPEPESSYPSREEARQSNHAAAEPLSSGGRELITQNSSLQSEHDENDSSTSSVSDHEEELPPQALLEATLVEEGQKPEIVDAMSVEIEIPEPDEKPLKRWIWRGCCLLIVVVMSVFALALSLGPKSQKATPHTETITVAPSASPTFDRGINWKQLGSVIYGEDENDVSGKQLKLSHDGKVVAISAHENNGAHGAKSGHIRVYKWDDDSQDWLQLGKDIDGPGPYGYITGTSGSLALSGDGNVVAFASTRTQVATRGTYVYAWDSNENIWTQLGSSTVEGEEPPITSGAAVELSEDGHILAVSSKLHNSLESPRKVTIFQWNEEQAVWEQRGETLPMEGDKVDDLTFGDSISMNADGSVVAVSTSIPSHDQELEGMTRVYTWDGFAWSQLGQELSGYSGLPYYVEPDQDLSADGKTLSIKLSDHIVIVTLNETTGRWASKGDAVPIECDYMALSDDGDRFAAILWNSHRQTSEAFLYEWSGTKWTRQGWMTLSYQERDGYAKYLSLSGNGQVVAIGDLDADHQVNTTLTLKDTGAVSLYAWPLENEKM